MNTLISKTCGMTAQGAACLRTPAYTAFALVAFAANSVICRMALGDASIDPASFSTIRLVSGAVALWAIVGVTRKEDDQKPPGDWVSAAMLFLYAVTFSFAYVSLKAGIGALILFGSVQATMIISALLAGERPRMLEWCGLIIAFAGLVYLVLPGLEAPSLSGAALMAGAGISWGIYSLRGRSVENPVAVTGGNFLRSVPLVLLTSLVLAQNLNVTTKGALLAFLSGSLTSGIGYVIWYAALRSLSATRAATVQLLVPTIAAAGGVLLLSEPISMRLILASIMIIGGVGTAILLKTRSG